MPLDIDFKESEKELLLQILKALKSIRYGYVQIIVQDSKVVQIDKTEKIRFDKENSHRYGVAPKNKLSLFRDTGLTKQPDKAIIK